MARVALCGAVTLAGVIASSASAADSSKMMAANRKIMHRYAACVVEAKRERAAEAILSNEDNATIMRRYPDLLSGDCLGKVAGNVKMAFGGDLYRYALADALVNDALASRVDTSFTDRLPLAHLAMPDSSALATDLARTKSKRKRNEIQTSYDKKMTISWLSRYGECVVRQDPVKARLWLLTPPGGPEEVSRINDLRSAFGICLGEGTAKFNRVTMRGTTAINYYRLAMATRQPISGKTH